MPLSEETKRTLREKGREDLIEVSEINDSGYAGILSTGEIVDRRKHPEAIPIQENRMMGIPKPKPIDRDNLHKFTQKMITSTRRWISAKFPSNDTKH
jgi:hypothetical protein